MRGPLLYGGLFLCAAVLAASTAAAGVLHKVKDYVEDRMPEVGWSVAPETARAREDIRVEVRPFAPGEWTCRVSLLLRKERTDPFPCGSQAAAISLAAPDFIRPTTVTVALGFCSPQGYSQAHKFVCWGKEKKVRVVPALRGGGDAARRGDPGSGPPRAAQTPAGSFKAEAPEGDPQEAPPAGPAVPDPALPEPSVRSGAQRVRGLDGKTYEVPGDSRSFAGKNRDYRGALLQDEFIRKGYADWPRLTREERLELLRRAASLHAAIFGTSVAQVGFRSLERNRLGVYTGDRIWVDPGKRAFQNPDEALGLLTHEATHHYQRELVGKLRAGKLQPGTEEHRLAEEWGAEMERYCCEYCEKRCDYAEYRAQSVERSAFEAGEAATLQLRRQRAGGGAADGF